MLGFQLKKYAFSDLITCPCDNLSAQSDRHLFFFCHFYKEKRAKFI